MNLYQLNRKFGMFTIFSVFLLLLAGGIVRCTGSGMGCPDWPKCFGLLAPPTDVSQLPSNYRTIYYQKRLEKAKKFATLLEKLGLKKQAAIILNEPNLHIHEEFNARKAWTEYCNRMVSVLSGFFAIGFFITLILIRKQISNFKYWCGISAFIVMIFNGWFGSIVVATNLFPIIVSIHYLAAYGALALYMFSVLDLEEAKANKALIKFKWFYVLLFIISIVQIFYGTLLRQVSDNAILDGTLYANNKMNLSALGNTFNIHQLLAITLVILSIFIYWKQRNDVSKNVKKILLSLTIVLILQYGSGILNLRFHFPSVPQILHVFLAGFIFAFSLYICQLIFKRSS